MRRPPPPRSRKLFWAIYTNGPPPDCDADGDWWTCAQNGDCADCVADGYCTITAGGAGAPSVVTFGLFGDPWGFTFPTGTTRPSHSPDTLFSINPAGQ